jgi:hypothetical protein
VNACVCVCVGATPAIYTRVSMQMPWITSVVGDLRAPSPSPAPGDYLGIDRLPNARQLTLAGPGTLQVAGARRARAC